MEEKQNYEDEIFEEAEKQDKSSNTKRIFAGVLCIMIIAAIIQVSIIIYNIDKNNNAEEACSELMGSDTRFYCCVECHKEHGVTGDYVSGCYCANGVVIGQYFPGAVQ
jgi:hypothetical protein